MERASLLKMTPNLVKEMSQQSQIKIMKIQKKRVKSESVEESEKSQEKVNFQTLKLDLPEINSQQKSDNFQVPKSKYRQLIQKMIIMGLIQKGAEPDENAHFQFCQKFVENQMSIIGQTKQIPPKKLLEYNFYKALKYDIKIRKKMEVVHWFSTFEQRSRFKIMHPGYKKIQRRIMEYIENQKENKAKFQIENL